MPGIVERTPADVLPFFQLPVTSQFSQLAGSAVQVAQPDPNRVLIIFCVQNTGEFIVTPQAQSVLLTPPPGYTVAVKQTLRFSYFVDGPLAAYAWFAFCSTSGDLSVTTHSLNAGAEAAFGSMPLNIAPSKPTAPKATVQGRLAALWHKLTGGL